VTQADSTQLIGIENKGTNVYELEEKLDMGTMFLNQIAQSA